MMGSEKGSVLVIVITGITIIAAIGAGLAAMVSSGARSGANHSLSVQALYAAESGLEWAGSELRDSSNWVGFCETLEGETKGIGQANFTIGKSELYLDDEDDPQGCKVPVSGWVGSDEDNPLAKRQLVGKVSRGFIENSGGELDEDWVIYDGGPLPDNLHSGQEVKVYVKEGTEILDEIVIGNHSKVYFSKNVTVGDEEDGIINLKPNGDAYFGDGFTMHGNIQIQGDACFKNNITINGNLIIENQAKAYLGDDVTINGDLIIDGEACFGDNLVHNDEKGKIDISSNGIFCGGASYNIDCDKIEKKNNSILCSSENDFCGLGLCDDGYNVICSSRCDAFNNDFCKELGGVSQNPVNGTGDDGWSEG